eukprot:1136797-Pelagomonas_calceolata.AAC.9
MMGGVRPGRLRKVYCDRTPQTGQVRTLWCLSSSGIFEMFGFQRLRGPSEPLVKALGALIGTLLHKFLPHRGFSRPPQKLISCWREELENHGFMLDDMVCRIKGSTVPQEHGGRSFRFLLHVCINVCCVASDEALEVAGQSGIVQYEGAACILRIGKVY